MRAGSLLFAASGALAAALGLRFSLVDAVRPAAPPVRRLR